MTINEKLVRFFMHEFKMSFDDALDVYKRYLVFRSGGKKVKS